MQPQTYQLEGELLIKIGDNTYPLGPIQIPINVDFTEKSKPPVAYRSGRPSYEDSTTTESI